jgi:hypothetical protein
MIDNFIDSALIIDDDRNEVKELIQFLEEKDVWVKHYTPEELEKRTTYFKNRKIIFLDLFLDDTDSQTNNIARIRKYLKKYLGNEFGSYGIILWTKHVEHLDEFREKISGDRSVYCLPLFIIGLDKTKYLRQGNYNGILEDLDAELSKNTAATFFIEWEVLAKKGKDHAIMNIYNLLNDYTKQDINLKYILFLLAKNHTGVPDDKLLHHNLTQDAIKAFGDMLHYEIVKQSSDSTNVLFKDIDEVFYQVNTEAAYYEYSSKNQLSLGINDKIIKKNGTILSRAEKKEAPHKDVIDSIEKEILKIIAEINSKIHFDSKNLNQQIVIPGNIYEIKSDGPFKIPSDSIPDNSVNILVEITPPCDFSNNKKGSLTRILGGYICNYSQANLDKIGKAENIYKEVRPVIIGAGVVAQIIVFDFRYFGSLPEDDLKTADKYLLVSKMKDKLFADLLQKLSAHTARLGLSIIH